MPVIYFVAPGFLRLGSEADEIIQLFKRVAEFTDVRLDRIYIFNLEAGKQSCTKPIYHGSHNDHIKRRT
jgi:hypothetical protein